jgi:hypothetical protein
MMSSKGYGGTTCLRMVTVPLNRSTSSYMPRGLPWILLHSHARIYNTSTQQHGSGTSENINQRNYRAESLSRPHLMLCVSPNLPGCLFAKRYRSPHHTSLNIPKTGLWQRADSSKKSLLYMQTCRPRPGCTKLRKG